MTYYKLVLYYCICMNSLPCFFVFVATLAVGLLMVVGCFAVGYFSATTTTTTTTAHPRVSLPNGNSRHIYKPFPS